MIRLKIALYHVTPILFLLAGCAPASRGEVVGKITTLKNELRALEEQGLAAECDAANTRSEDYVLSAVRKANKLESEKELFTVPDVPFTPRYCRVEAVKQEEIKKRVRDVIDIK